MLITQRYQQMHTNKILARGKSLSVSDLMVAGLAPNLWVDSRSLFSNIISSIIRRTAINGSVCACRDRDLTIGVRRNASSTTTTNDRRGFQHSLLLAL
jgi:hypothetical protein